MSGEGQALPAEAPEASASTTRVACVVCREPISLGAELCVHCDSAQNWTRHILRWSTVGASLIALVPLWTGACALRALVFEQKADVRLLPLECGAESIRVAAANLGGRPALLERYQLLVESATSPKSSMPAFELRAENGDFLLEPGDVKTYSLQPSVEGVPVAAPAAAAEDLSCKYRIRTRAIDFEGTARDVETACACPEGT